MDNTVHNPTRPALLPALTGIILLGAGLYLCAGILQELAALYQDVGSNAFIQALTSRFTDKALFEFDDKPLVINEAGALLMALFGAILIGLLALHIAMGLIRTGGHLLSPAFSYQMARMKMNIQELKSNLK